MPRYLDGFKAGLDYATDGTGEIDGTKINIRYVDDAGDPDKAVTAAKELIGEGINILAGSASSGVAAAVAEQAAQNRVLFISGPAAVVGVPDEVWGERGYAFVVTRGPVSEDELLAHARTRLAGFKLPRDIEFLPELPRSTIDKVARTQLQQRAIARLGEIEGRTQHAGSE